MDWSKRGYWADEHEHSFMDHLEGMAAFAGIVAAGLVTTGPLLSRMGGRVGASIAKQLAMGTGGRLARWGGELIGTGVESAFRTMSNPESNALVYGVEQLQKNIATAVGNMNRINYFLDTLSEHTLDKEAFQAARADFAKLLHPVGKAGRMTEITEEDFLHPSVLSLFNKQAQAKGIKWAWHNEGDLRQQRRVFQDLAANAVKQTPDPAQISAFTEAPENREAIFAWLQAARDAHAERTTATKKMFKINSADIKWREINEFHGNPHFDPVKRDLVEQTLERVGMADPGKGRVAAMITEARDKAEKLFTYMDAGVKTYNSEAVERLMTMFGETSTGLSVLKEKHGQVAISMAQFRNAKDKFVKAALDEFQIPLVPFLFSVPGKMATLMNPTKDLVQNLGHLSTTPELQRMAKLGLLNMENTPHAQLIGMGGRVMGIIPDADGGPKLSLLEQSFVAFNKRGNNHISKWSDLRSLDLEGHFDDLFKFRQERNVRSSLMNSLSANQNIFGEISYSPETGFNFHPKSPIYAPLVNKLHGRGVGVPIGDLHPTQLAKFLASEEAIAHMSPDDYYSALTHVITEARKARVDISPSLRRMGQRINSGAINADFPEQYDGILRQLLLNSGDVSRTTSLLNEKVGSSKVITSMTSELQANASQPFYQAITMLRVDQENLGLVTAGEGNAVYNLSRKFLGNSGISTAMEKLQEGELAEVLHGLGRAKIDALGGAGASPGAAMVEDLFDVLNKEEVDITALRNLKITPYLRNLGYFDASNNPDIIRLRTLLAHLTEEVNKGGIPTIQVKHKELAELGTALLENHEILDLSEDAIVHSKLINVLRNNLDELGMSVEAKNKKLIPLTHEAKLIDTLESRFTIGKGFHPEEQELSPYNISRYYVVPHSMPSVSEIVNSNGKELFNYITKGQFTKNVGQYFRSLVDVNTPTGPLASLTTMLFQMPQHIAETVGLGLPGADRTTALRTLGGFIAKRVLPLYVGYEAYKNLNANMHSVDLPGLDDMGANVVGNFNLMTADFKDMLGITALSKNLVNSLPGLDQYFHPRSRDEYNDYLFYGDEGVRQGRGWVIGSRSPVTGGKVSYFRPNFYRRWKSHWTEADNVDISNPEYSFLPNIQNPLAPIFRLINPNWWVHKHRTDRPYESGGMAVQEPEGDYLMINSNGTGPLATGGFGHNLPVKLEAGSAGFGSPGGGAVHINFHKEVPPGEVEGTGLYNTAVDWLEAARNQMGMYGAMMQRLPFYPHKQGAFEPQDPSAATSMNRMFWMGEYGELTGQFGEFFRRFIQDDGQSTDAYNPLPNNMPKWLPAKFHRGDPYMRTRGIGELQLPGDAFERTHPWIAPLKIRGSSIGYSEEDIIHKWLNPMEPLSGANAEDYTSFGSRAHKLIQRKLNDQGLLIDAEVQIYDKEHNISGTIDALIRGETGDEIIDIKTQGSKSWGETPEKYIDQITAYMAITGLRRAHLAFVNRDNMQETRIESFDFDPARWHRILDKIDRARKTVTHMVEKGEISPFETYDLLSRIEILAQVAPNSAEFREAVEFAQSSGGFGGFERQRFEQALAQAAILRQDYNLYPHRYNVQTETENLLVKGINEDGSIATDMGTIKLAGVDWSPQAFIYEDPEEVMSKFGVTVGEEVPVTLIKGQFNPEVMADMPTLGIIKGLNERLIHSDYASPDADSRHPLASQVVRGNPIMGQIWESLAHKDNLITNKFLRVRSALEQFERGEVFGTDYSRWDSVFTTFVEPTINSFIRKDPLTAGIQSAIVASMFVKSSKVRGKAALIGGIIGAGASLIRGGYELLSGNTWTPPRYRKQAEFDEYWDTLEYLKYTAIAEAAKTKAKEKEHVDIDKLEGASTYQFVGLGPYSVLAINAERKAKRTMYGIDTAASSLSDVLAAIPQRQRQIVEELISSGSIKEKQRFYDLLPDSEKRVLGKFLGVNTSDLPERPTLTEYFSHHMLPELSWKGWDADVDDEDLETRAAAKEGVKITRPTRTRVEKARALTKDVIIPRMDSPTVGNIKDQIERMISDGSFGNIQVNYTLRASNQNIVNLNFDLKEDQTHLLANEMKNQSN